MIAAQPRPSRALALLALLALLVPATGATADLVHLPDGGALQAAIDAAAPGDVIDLGDGRFAGPIRIARPIVLRGRAAIIEGDGSGTVLVLAAARARVEGITIRNSGRDIGAPDACIYVEPEATASVVRGCTLEQCGFGIWIHETEGVQILDNRVESREEVRSADRGNGIHLFNASNLVVRGNRVRRARDGIYVSATEDSSIEGNVTSEVRFGIHYMYSYRNRVVANEANDNTIGIALMESRDLVVEDNVAERNTREGLLFRDVTHSTIRRNALRHNGTGMFFYSSVENAVEDNEVVHNELGMKVWAGTRRNRVEGNVIRGNRIPVFYVGAEDQIWGEGGRGNYWGGYLGWDQDGDGVGDRPHRVDSFVASLLYRHPSAVLLLRSPALEMLSHLADRLVLLRAPTIVDRSPLLARGPR